MRKFWMALAAGIALTAFGTVAFVSSSSADFKAPTAVAKKYCPTGWKVKDFKSDKDYLCVPEAQAKPAECKGPYWECTGCQCKCWPYEPPK